MSEDAGAIAAGHSAEEQQISEATTTAEEAKAQSGMAAEAAVVASETADAATGIAVVAGATAVETADQASQSAESAGVQAEEAHEEAQAARSETAELRDWLGERLKGIEDRLFPPEEEESEAGNEVEEITLDDADVGESGTESDSQSGTSVVSGSDSEDSGESGSQGAASTGKRAGGRRFNRGGHRR